MGRSRPSQAHPAPDESQLGCEWPACFVHGRTVEHPLQKMEERKMPGCGSSKFRVVGWGAGGTALNLSPRPSALVPRRSGFGRAVSRILSAPCGGENHLSMQPYPESVRLRGSWSGPPRGFPIWPCTRWGFPCRVACASRGALLPHLFTITAGLRRRLFDFLWHCPSAGFETGRLRVSPAKPELRSITPCGVRTFLPRLAPGAILRPAKTS